MAMQQVNFYQPQFRPQQIIFPAQRIVLIAALTVVILLIFSVYFSQKITAQITIISQQQQRVNASNTQLAQLQQQLSKRTSDERLLAQYQTLQQQLNSKQSVYNYLSSYHFGNRDGFSSLLEGLSQQRIDNVWLTAFSLLDAGNTMALQGSSKQSTLIPEYIDSLAQSEQFQGQQFSAFEVEKPSDKSHDYHFKLQTDPSNKAGL